MNNIPVSFSTCPQCGFSHPPVKPGEQCPLAVNKTTIQQHNTPQNKPQTVQQPQIQQPSQPFIPQTLQMMDINKFLVDLRNIILSQTSIKKIKDPQKLFKNIIIEVAKALENHKD